MMIMVNDVCFDLFIFSLKKENLPSMDPTSNKTNGLISSSLISDNLYALNFILCKDIS